MCSVAPKAAKPKLREAVERVDAAMCKIRDAGKVKARDRIAVLAALNLAFDLAQLEKAAPAAPPAAAGEAPPKPPIRASSSWCSASTRRWPATATCSRKIHREAAPYRRKIAPVCGARWALYFLEPMLYGARAW